MYYFYLFAVLLLKIYNPSQIVGIQKSSRMNVWINEIVIKQWQLWGVKSCYHSASGMFSIRHAHLSLWQKWPRSHFFFLVERNLLLSEISGVFFTLEEFVLWHMCILVRKDLVGLLIWYMMNENHYFIYFCWHSPCNFISCWKRVLKAPNFVCVLSQVWFISVAQSCLILCDPMDYSTPGFHVHHQLLEPIQTHVHCVGDAIQPSHPLSSPSPPAFNLFQHQGLFWWVGSSHQVAKVLEFLLQHQSF